MQVIEFETKRILFKSSEEEEVTKYCDELISEGWSYAISVRPKGSRMNFLWSAKDARNVTILNRKTQ